MTLLTVYFAFAILLAVALVRTARVYEDGRAFPSKVLQYVNRRFKEINSELIWDNKNYLEKWAAKYASCNYEEGTVEGFAKIPENSSYVTFIELKDIPGTGVSIVSKNLYPIIDYWVEKKRYNTQIIGAKRFACSVSPGCGRGEERMGVSCVFSPSSEPYTGPDDEDPPYDSSSERAEAEPLTAEQYLRAQQTTLVNFSTNKFLENLSLLETSCEMLEEESWNFLKAQHVVAGLGMKVHGIFGKAPVETNVDDALEKIFIEMGKTLPPNIQIGCSLIDQCKKDSGKVVVSCIYEEKCRREVCF